MQEAWLYTLGLVCAYLLGSVPVGDLVCRALGVDIRNRGTGNPGAANIFREVGLIASVVVFALDLSKGAVAIMPFYLFELPTWIGLIAMVSVLGGHIFPVFWRFRGGTGLVVGMGTTIAMLPFGFLFAVPITVLAVKVTKNITYLAALFFFLTIVSGAIFHEDLVRVVSVLLAASIIWVKSRIQYRDK